MSALPPRAHRLLILACSATKRQDDGYMPAIDRYDGPLWQTVRCHAGDRKMLKRSEEHTSELQSLMRISYAVFCLKKKNKQLMLISMNMLHIIPTYTTDKLNIHNIMLL